MRVLESAVEGALRTTPVRLAQWSVEEIFAGDGQGLGVFRVTGSAQADDSLRDWSVILKVLPDESAAPTNGWSLAVRGAARLRLGLVGFASGRPWRAASARPCPARRPSLSAMALTMCRGACATTRPRRGSWDASTGLSHGAPASGCGVAESRLAALVACRRRSRDRRSTTSPRAPAGRTHLSG